MSLSDNKKIVENNYKYSKIDDNSYVIYSNQYYFNTTDNLPLIIKFGDNDNCLLTDGGEFINKCDEINERFNYNDMKIIELLNRYNAIFDNHYLIVKCKAEKLPITISNYFNLLAILYNEVTL